MRTLVGLGLLLFGAVNAFREYTNLSSLPEGTELSFRVGLFFPSLAFIAAGIYLMATTGKR